MLEKIKKDVFFVSRLFVVLYLSLFLLISYEKIDYLPALILGVYTFNNIYIYFFSRPKFLRLIAVLFDLTLIPLFILFSESFLTLYSLTILISLYAWRKLLIAFLLVLVSGGLSFYFFHNSPLLLTAHLLLFLGVFFSSYNFEYATVVSKERKRILKLKSDYHKLLKEFSRFERERRLLANLRKIFKLLRESRDPKEYLSAIRREFGVKRISVIPTSEAPTEVLKDYESASLEVGVKLDKGYAKVVYEFDSPFLLRDELLTSSLVEATKMLPLLVEGFEQKEEGKSVLVVG
ncbi:MAG: hypothetical protein GXO04_01880 [Aquificae bacterium]|nr:hypothetical protein [Aquificota bacterium]